MVEKGDGAKAEAGFHYVHLEGKWPVSEGPGKLVLAQDLAKVWKLEARYWKITRYPR